MLEQLIHKRDQIRDTIVEFQDYIIRDNIWILHYNNRVKWEETVKGANKMVNKIKHNRNRAQSYRQHIINTQGVEAVKFVKDKNRSFLEIIYKLTNIGMSYNKI